MRNQKQTTLKIFQWNCRSILPNSAYLTHFLSQTECQVLTLQSLNTTFAKLPHLPDYYYPPTCEKGALDEKKYTAIYVHKSLSYNDCQYPSTNSNNNFYSCAVTVNFDKIQLNIASIYLPRGPNDLNTEWIRNLPNQLSGKWVLAGDFNAHSPFWEKGCNIVTNNRLVENIVDSSFYILNDGSITRIPDVHNHKSTAIDLTLISPELVPLCSWETLKDSLGRDHLPIITTLLRKERHVINCKDEMIPKYSDKNANWGMFESILSFQQFDDFEDDNIDNMYSHFTKSVLTVANLSLSKLKGGNNYSHVGNVWWTKECEEVVNFKRKAFKEYISNKSPENHAKMKKANAQCNKQIAVAKKEYWTAFCSSAVYDHSDLCKVWDKVKEIKNGTSIPNCPIINDSQNSVLSDEDKTEIFAETFSKNSQQRGLSPNHRIYRQKEEQSPKYNDPHPENELWFNQPITLEELKFAIDSIENKKTSVGIDAISNQMIKHLSGNCLIFLHKIIQKCWKTGIMPQAWKKSIVIPIAKAGKPKQDKNSYRPISLTSHVSKLMEKIILYRLEKYCNKNKVIPVNQAGFRKGRSTVEHLVKITTQIKHQFARRKSVMATFFDVKKAYDQVWHKRLLYKLKTIGISGSMYNYIKDFLVNRMIQTRIGGKYSNPRTLDMGIPQGSVIAPLLFNILIHDLPNAVSKNVVIVQYADDICMWMKLTVKKATNNRQLNHIRRLYQLELDNISNYMFENGLSLSSEKTHMMLFNSGDNPKNKPVFKLSGQALEYANVIKFLGIYFTPKLSWNIHFDYMLTKARQSINFLKIISRLPWAMDSQTLIHLSTALVRSRLCYGQEIFFCAPNYLLQKAESVDCKALKIALGVPVHASNKQTYAVAGILPLTEYRELACAKFVVRYTSISDNFIKNELQLKSDSNFPKRALNISSQKSIKTYVTPLFKDSDENLENVVMNIPYPPVPSWELLKANFDIDYLKQKKDDNINITASLANLHIIEQYHDYLHIFTDGSLMETIAGASFTIPSQKVKKSFYIGKNVSIFTAELIGVIQALKFIIDSSNHIPKAVFFIDSKSVLYALKSFSLKTRPDLIIEASQIIHSLIESGTEVSLCWIPSHVGISGNEIADKSARDGVQRPEDSTKISVLLSVSEIYHILEKTMWKRLRDRSESRYKRKKLHIPPWSVRTLSVSTFRSRMINSIYYRILLNALKTKFSKNVKCICGESFTLNHALFYCATLSNFLPKNFTEQKYTEDSLETIIANDNLVYDIAVNLFHSPVSKLL